MYSLDHLLIESDVVTSMFACDLQACKGACCTIKGGGGAPVLDEEVSELESVVAVVREFLDPRSLEEIDATGVVIGSPGHWETTCIDDGACVFVYWEGDIARCSIEKAFHSGATSFRKPLSCHLFPIRVSNFGGPYLRYERFDECEPGRRSGEQSGTPLVVTVRDAVERAYGHELANKLVELTGQISNGGNP